MKRVFSAVGRGVFVIGATLVAMIVYTFFVKPAVTVLPVSLPDQLVKAGYLRSTASQAVAAHMAQVAGLQGLTEAEDLEFIGPRNVSDFSSTLDLADIQVPGQPFSFRAAARFIRTLFGDSQPTVSITIARSDADHVIRATAVGGPYVGRRRSRSVGKDVPPEKMMLTAAALAVSVIQPLRYAAFLDQVSTRRGECPAGLTCTPAAALTVIGGLLADDYEEDDARAHLLYAAVSRRQGNIRDALRHCEAATVHKVTRERGLLECSYALDANGERKCAIRAVLSGFPDSSDEPDIYAAFGDRLLAFEEYQQAESAYGMALQLDGRHVYALIGLGTIDRHKKRFDSAGKHYSDALLVNPSEPYALGGLGASLVELGEFKEGLFYAERSLCIDPKYEVAKKARTTALVALGRDDTKLQCDGEK